MRNKWRQFCKKKREDIDNILYVKFIYEIEYMEWVFPIVIIPKTNGKI